MKIPEFETKISDSTYKQILDRCIKEFVSFEYAISFQGKDHSSNPIELDDSATLCMHIVSRQLKATVKKFIAGQKEHGGNLLDRDLNQDMRDEAIDMGVYAIAQEIKEELEQEKERKVENELEAELNSGTH